MSSRIIICNKFTMKAVDECMNVLGSEGGEIYLPPGIYKGENKMDKLKGYVLAVLCIAVYIFACFAQSSGWLK